MTMAVTATSVRQPGFARRWTQGAQGSAAQVGCTISGPRRTAPRAARSGARVVRRQRYGFSVVAHGGVATGSSRAGASEWATAPEWAAANNVVPLDAPIKAPSVHQVIEVALAMQNQMHHWHYVCPAWGSTGECRSGQLCE